MAEGREKTGRRYKDGTDICLGDHLKFRCDGISGRGIVCRGKDLGLEWEFCVKDLRKYPECKSRNEGRMYPFYDQAVYTKLEDADANIKPEGSYADQDTLMPAT